MFIEITKCIVQQCTRDYAEGIENCPCNSNCPNGCPCPDFVCPSISWILTLTSKDWFATMNCDFIESSGLLVAQLKTILVNLEQQAPIIIEGDLESKLINFAFEPETEAEDSCSVIWQNQMYVFGGWTYMRQISLVDQCHLKRVGTLPFLLARGACTNFRNDEIFLCFNSNALVGFDKSYYQIISQNFALESTPRKDQSNRCFYAEDPLANFTESTPSTYQHSDTSIASNEGKFIHFVTKKN